MFHDFSISKPGSCPGWDLKVRPGPSYFSHLQNCQSDVRDPWHAAALRWHHLQFQHKRGLRYRALESCCISIVHTVKICQKNPDDSMTSPISPWLPNPPCLCVHHTCIPMRKSGAIAPLLFHRHTSEPQNARTRLGNVGNCKCILVAQIQDTMRLCGANSSCNVVQCAFKSIWYLFFPVDIKIRIGVGNRVLKSWKIDVILGVMSIMSTS